MVPGVPVGRAQRPGPGVALLASAMGHGGWKGSRRGVQREGEMIEFGDNLLLAVESPGILVK